jgi:hypothetical protein
VIGAAGAASRRISWDDVKAAQPDVVVVAACGYDSRWACQVVCVNGLLILWLGRGSSALDGVPVLAAVKLGRQVRLGSVLTAAARRRCWPGWRNPAVRASLVWLVTRSLPTGRGRPG